MAGTPGSITEAQRQQVIDLIKAGGKGRNVIAREVGIGAASVTKIAGEAGLSFDRSKTQAATAAQQADNAARRASLVDRLYRRAEVLLDRLEAPKFKTLTKLRGGAETPAELEFVPTDNERELASSISTYLQQAARLEAIDADAGDKPAVDAWLEAMTGGEVSTPAL